MSGSGAGPSEALRRAPARFRERGREITRLEGFSDCSFGFAITLLVLSLEVPTSFEQLLTLMRGVPTFAVTFAMVAYIWYTQYRYYRRFGTEDVWTVVLNMALLFVVLVYVYPLKFLFGVAILGNLQSARQTRELYLLYGAGFFAVFLVLGALYVNGLRQAGALGLTPLERVMTRGWIEEQWTTALVGVLSAVLALIVPQGLLSLPGFAYFAVAISRSITGFHARHLATRVASPDP